MRSKFELKFFWLITFACLVHLNMKRTDLPKVLTTQGPTLLRMLSLELYHRVVRFGVLADFLNPIVYGDAAKNYYGATRSVLSRNAKGSSWPKQ